MGCNCEWSCTCERDARARQVIESLMRERSELADSYRCLEEAIENEDSNSSIVRLYRYIRDSKDTIKSYENELEELL